MRSFFLGTSRAQSAHSSALYDGRGVGNSPVGLAESPRYDTLVAVVAVKREREDGDGGKGKRKKERGERKLDSEGNIVLLNRFKIK